MRIQHLIMIGRRKSGLGPCRPDAKAPRRRFPLAAVALPFALISTIVLSACGGEQTRYASREDEAQIGQSGIFGPSGLSLFGGAKTSDPENANGIGVNSFLWRASLDTISFMPLASADPFGGVIITDYYSPPDTPDQRLKVSVFISDRKLTANGVKASVFRQERSPDGRWTDAPVDPQTATKLENAILSRARELRVTTTQAK